MTQLAVEPQGSIYICKTPLENDYQNQLTFASASAQATYFATTVQKTLTQYTYVRKDSSIVVDAKYDDIRDCNYLYYVNTGFSNKTFYCFITDIEYVSEDSTRIKIETDVMQTYYFDIVYHPCFVEREHVSDDTVGLHTVPEPVETGEYEIVDTRGIPMWELPPDSQSYESPYLTCFCVTDYPDDIQNLNSHGNIQGDDNQIGGVFSSLKFFATQDTIEAELPAFEGSHLMELVYNRSGHGVTADAIKNVFMIPSCLVNIMPTDDDTPSSQRASYVEITDGGTSLRLPFYSIKNFWLSDEIDVKQPQTLAENYVPVNKKLLTYPFSYFYITNNAGFESEYHYEDFPFKTTGIAPYQTTQRTITYQVGIVPSCGVSAKMYFVKYKNIDTDVDPSYLKEIYNYGIPFAKLPTCAWTTDYYTNWLTQNAVNNTNNAITGVMSGIAMGALAGLTGGIGAGFITAGVMGGVNLLKGVTDATNRNRIAETTPNSAKGDTNTGDFTFCFKRNAMNLYHMSVRPEYAKIADQYFSLFGYKVNEVKTPQFNSRTEWNYIKTIGCNVDGNIPQGDLSTIRKIFDSGCTFWHNASHMYNYSLANNIVS